MGRLLDRVRQFATGILGRASPLVGARLGSATVTFALPLVLVRVFSPAAFGTYKQFFLVAQTVLLLGQLGLTQSLAYFLPRGGDERGAFLAQALLGLSTMGALGGLALYGAAPTLALWLGDGELAGLRLPLALYAATMLTAAPLEAALTSEGRIGGAALAYLCSDAGRAGAMIAGALARGPRGLYFAAALVGLLRVGVLVTLVARRILPAARPCWSAARAQLGYCLPFAGAGWLHVGQRYFPQYAVSIFFPAASFALYAVASFHMPVVDIVFTPVNEVLIVELSRAFAACDRRAALRAWDEATDRLATVLYPAAAGAWLLGRHILPILFTDNYGAAVPLFVVATFEILLWTVPCDGLLRAAGDTRFLFGFNAGRVALTAGCVLGGIRVAGLGGALAGAIFAESIARVGLIARARRFLGVPLSGMLDWTQLGRIAAAAALASVPAWMVRHFAAPSVGSLVAAVLVYGVSYLTLRARLGRAQERAPGVGWVGDPVGASRG
jgi:O-antigen/teichoic acid export membrane protein